MARKQRNAKRNATIFSDYHGINDTQERVPAIVLASRYGVTRARIYQILSQEEAQRSDANPRITFRKEPTEADAQLVAEILSDLLEAR